MGSAKDAIMAHEESLAAATAYLVQKGFLEKCEYHGEIFWGW